MSSAVLATPVTPPVRRPARITWSSGSGAVVTTSATLAPLFGWLLLKQAYRRHLALLCQWVSGLSGLPHYCEPC